MGLGTLDSCVSASWRLGIKGEPEALVLVDNKAVIGWNPVLETQMLTYLRLTGLKLGLVINFGERVPEAGNHRVVNGLPEEADAFNAKARRRNWSRGNAFRKFRSDFCRRGGRNQLLHSLSRPSGTEPITGRQPKAEALG